MKNVVSQLFPRRSLFDLTHDRKLSFDMGQLIPVFLKEMIPGDTFNIEAGFLLRFAAMPGVVMHRYNVFFHYFFGPNRLVYDDWEKFITQGEKGDQNPTPPTIALPASQAAIGTLSDYFGLPVTAPTWAGTGGHHTVNAMPFRLRNLIYNEWYRDEWLQTPLVINKAGGTDATTDYSMVYRNWEKDYFTSCLPDTQKGAEVTISLGDSADVSIDDPEMHIAVGADNLNDFTFHGSEIHYLSSENKVALTDDANEYDQQPVYANKGQRTLTGTADLSTATPISIGDLRLAVQLQKWEERNARAGSRYRESLQAHFGVVVPDFRLQRPEFVGGAKIPVAINEVLQTSATQTGSPQGNMSGHGMAIGQIPRIRYSAVEHGFLMGFITVMPKTAYQQGTEKMWNKPTRYDYFWPEFAHLSEQPVLKREIFTNGDGVTADAEPFGYRGYGDEYRLAFSQVCGDFRTTMDFWHSGRIFDSGSQPELNSTFLKCIPDDRIFSDENPSDKNIWMHILHSVKALRPMPVVADPGLMDHF